MRIAPWKDFDGKVVIEGDELLHPSGQRGRVIYNRSGAAPADCWFVRYDGETGLARLSLQLGDKGQAITVNTVYMQNGYDDRAAYLDSLAEEYGEDAVLALADLLGPEEDFDGLVTSLQDT